MTYRHLQAYCLYTGISSGPNARYRVWEAFTFLPFNKLKEPPHLKHVATIPREVLSENFRQYETGAAINNKSQGTVANFRDMMEFSVITLIHI